MCRQWKGHGYKMKIIVSACLIGDNCKYNGGNNYNEKVIDFLKGHEVIAVCPEVMGGLSVPRIPSEIVNGVVTSKNGCVVDRQFREGAKKAMEIALNKKADCAILQSRSPSCGVNQVYDGTFSGNKINGMGVFAELLKNNNIKTIDVEDL